MGRCTAEPACVAVSAVLTNSALYSLSLPALKTVPSILLKDNNIVRNCRFAVRSVSTLLFLKLASCACWRLPLCLAVAGLNLYPTDRFLGRIFIVAARTGCLVLKLPGSRVGLPLLDCR